MMTAHNINEKFIKDANYKNKSNVNINLVSKNSIYEIKI